MELTAFTLGTSTVITIPKKIGVFPGTKFTAKKRGQAIILQPKERQTKLEKDLKLIENLAGGFTGKFDLKPEELNQNYELGTYGKNTR